MKSFTRLFAAILLALAATALPVLGVNMTPHQDGRSTPVLVMPAQGEAAVGNSRAGAEQFLKSHQADFRLPADLSNLEFVRARESLLGTHYRYRQVLNGVPVEGAEVVVSIRQDTGEVYQAYNDSYPVAAAPAMPKALLGREAALDVAWKHLRVHGKLLQSPEASLVYVPVKDGFRLVYKTLVSVEAPFGHWEHKVDAVTGEVLSVRDTAVRLTGKREPLPKFQEYSGAVWSRAQTTDDFQTEAAALKTATPVAKNVVDGSAKVFDGDPRTYLALASLIDTSAAATFTPAYVTRTLRQISENNGVYTLDGPWVLIVDFEAPTAAPSSTTTGNWTALRGNNAFNDAMTYFHIDQNQRYLQSLGYTGVRGVQYGPIHVDSNGVNGDDNSYFLPSSNQLSFGHGGVDDNEDPDVILHEYGHAITYDILPSWGGGDTGAIGEGFGDYWGGSYSYTTRNGQTFHPEWAFTWDGHSADSWPGRFLNMTTLTYNPAHSYVDHETINGIDNYSDQLWSAPLWAAFTTLTSAGYARTNVDKVLIETFFSIGGSPTMRSLAYAIVNTAANLFPSDPYSSVFNDKFLAQNILPPPPVPDPVLISPVGGETFATGSVVQVTWDRQGAPAAIATRLEYSAGVATNFADTMESGVNGWVVSHTGGALNWAQVTTASHSPSHSWYAKDQAFITQQYLRSPRISVIAGAVLSFWHTYNMEDQFDGGVVEISPDGTTWTDIGSLATQNGYNSTISYNYGSTIAGRMAFTGASAGWIETRIPLSAFAGQNVYIRFYAASDSDTVETGWWVDDVSVTKEWTPIGTAAAGASSYAWTAPLVAGSSYKLRIQQFASGYSDSAWVQSGAFTLGAVVVVPAPTIQSVTLNSGAAIITWSAVSGATYRVQYKNDLSEAAWTSLTPDVVAGSASASQTDRSAPAKRFYRVIVP